MTTETATRFDHDGLGLLALPRRVVRAFAARAAGRRSLAALRKLDDHLLRDVGLTREDVLDMTDRL